ncbi:hypothetical protein QBC32DRAFT_329932 [Pseudoneurospora amorphoporcata]|uniref:Uncharacterized protein n=1 Tax=Pseudoneurospora amorphoporcata TaxID=241081 RepID=A0AAN6SKP6_9PEZI|nr:hypothetical protein QBC32DRAFT_329932 [Pseudoneurospora amorphoporcata]
MAARVRGGCHASALIIVAHPFLLGHPFLVYGHDEQLSCLLGTLEFPKLAGRRAGRAVGLTGPSVHAAPRKGQKDEECWRRGPKLNHGQHEVGLGDSGPCCAVQRVNPELADVPGPLLATSRPTPGNQSCLCLEAEPCLLFVLFAVGLHLKPQQCSWPFL